MKISELQISGCYELTFPVHEDARGSFIKCFQASSLAEWHLQAEFKEVFYTVSGKDVLRGMHLQLPPADHYKLVYCLTGVVWDVILDLRRGSASFGEHVALELSAERRNGLYLPKGVAHGFCVLEAPALIAYHVSSEHAPRLDGGIAWHSFGADWPVCEPIVSERDTALPSLADFISPFDYQAVAPEPSRVR